VKFCQNSLSLFRQSGPKGEEEEEEKREKKRKKRRGPGEGEDRRAVK